MITQEKLSNLYDKYSREIYLYIFGFVKSEQKAEDLLHDVFVRVIEYSNKKPLELKNIRAFLYRIARNLCIDFSRKNKKLHFSQLDETFAAKDDLLVDLERKELFERIHLLLDKKSSFLRSVFYLKVELEMTYKEIAQVLAVSERTIKRKMHSLLKYLAEELEKSGFKDFYNVLLSLFL